MPSTIWTYTMKTTLLIDGDILLYALVHAHRKEVVIDDVVNYTLDLVTASQAADIFVAEVLEHYDADKTIIAFSYRGEHWRKAVLPEYKAGRKMLDRVEKPLGYWDLQAYLKETYAFEEWEPLEADDVLGILATQPQKALPGRRIVCSIDKDLRTIPGYYAGSWDGGVEVITEADADRFFMFQVLTGDPSDGYKGCPGIGKVKAKVIIDPLEDMHDLWNAVVLAYTGAGLTEADALQQAQVARILRHGEYNRETQEIKRWTPPA